MTESIFKPDSIINYIKSDKVNAYFEYPLKIITPLFSIFVVFGFIVVFLYFYNKGIAREAFSYIYSFQYLFFISLFSIISSIFVFITLNVTFYFYSFINDDKYINWSDARFKNKCNLILLLSTSIYFFIAYFSINILDSVTMLSVVIFPGIYLLVIHKKIKSNDKVNFWFIFIMCYGFVVISQMNILIFVFNILAKKDLRVDSLLLMFSSVFVFLLFLNFKKLSVKNKFFGMLIFVLLIPICINDIPNKIMNIIGFGGYKSTYIIKSDGVNIYDGLKLKPNSTKWIDKKSIKLIDVYVVANLPEKIIVSSNEKDHIMYSIPKSLILSEVFGVQPNDKN